MLSSKAKKKYEKFFLAFLGAGRDLVVVVLLPPPFLVLVLMQVLVLLLMPLAGAGASPPFSSSSSCFSRCSLLPLFLCSVLLQQRAARRETTYIPRINNTIRSTSHPQNEMFVLFSR
jgi:hypothetical protein